MAHRLLAAKKEAVRCGPPPFVGIILKMKRLLDPGRPVVIG